LNQSHAQLISEHEELQHNLQETQSNGSQTQQQLQSFKSNNRQWIQNFLSKLQAKVIEDVQNHEESEITQLVQTAVLKYNQIVREQEAAAKRLTEELATSQHLHKATADSL
jgi:pyrroloquinoline quinone (PQQ) biosynthesis protein C